MLSRFRVITLDAGETLLGPRPSFGEAFARICAEAGVLVNKEQIKQIQALSRQRLQDYQRLGLRFTDSTEKSQEFWIGLYRGFLTKMSVSENSLDEISAYLYQEFTRGHNYSLFDDVLETLDSLRSHGIRLGVVSNWEYWLERLLVELGIRSYFDFIVVSGLVGYEKPDTRIYRKAIECSGVDPSAMAHVGDSVESDVNGARAAGITPILLDRRGHYRQVDCLRVESLTELLSIDGPMSVPDIGE